jgi:ADP-ribose pyrophosphatase YjhB (NUDIX family)
MITFQHEQHRFTYRVVGIALDGERVLLHRAETEDFWSLPGGRCELGEPGATALAREMQEELGVTVRVERLVWVVENFFRYAGQDCHELGFYFLMTLPPGSPPLTAPGPFDGQEAGLRLIFTWFPLAVLPTLRLYPSFLGAGLQALPATTTHIVHRDADI